MTAQDIENFDIEAYRRERCHKLERENEFLRAERERLYTLLAEALRVAVAGTGVTPTALLTVIADLVGTDLAVAAFIEQRERRNAQALMLACCESFGRPREHPAP